MLVSAWQLLELGWRWIPLGLEICALVSIPSVLVGRRGRPVAAIGWTLALVGLPVLGVLCWWLLGRNHLERRKRRRRRASAVIGPRLEGVRASVLPPSSEAARVAPLWKLPGELGEAVFPPTSGNRVGLLPGGEAAFAAMERDIEAAEHHIHALFYIWKNDRTGRRFRDLLIAKARAGVQVRVLCDAVGSPAMATRFSRPLRKAGAKVRRFLPPSLLELPRINFRNHRKILVVDGKVGVISGFNIAEEYRTRWRDMGLRVRGPAVDQLQEVFADDWYYAAAEDLADPRYFGCWQDGASEPDEADDETVACAVLASGPDTPQAPIHDAVFMAINQASGRVWITTPYFIPSLPIVASLRTAAYRGVDVRLMVPGSANDVPLVRLASRAYYPELLEAGCRVFEYQPSMLHSKTFVFDDDLVLVGSANLDSRSFRLNFEASCLVGGASANRALAAEFAASLAECHEIHLDALENRPWLHKLVDATAHLLSPLL